MDTAARDLGIRIRKSRAAVSIVICPRPCRQIDIQYLRVYYLGAFGKVAVCERRSPALCGRKAQQLPVMIVRTRSPNRAQTVNCIDQQRSTTLCEI